MIHITIPDTQTLVESDTGRKYDAFNIHVNGAYHASIRYSHLLRLHEKLKDHFGIRLRTTDFPSKKIFKNLDKKALNERRLALARYFQTVVQQPDVALHFVTEQAFLTFQVESFRPSSSNVMVDIYMADGSKETVRCNVEHPTEIVLKRFAEIIGLDSENVLHFGLFLARERHADGNGQLATSGYCSEYPDVLCARLLKNFESPYISLQLLNQKSAASGIFYQIIIRKLVWDPSVEEALLDDPGAVLLLYKQAVNDLRNGRLGTLQSAIVDRLHALEAQGSCVQFLRLCHLQQTYSYEVLEKCVSDYPRPNTTCELKVGRRHIVLEYCDPSFGNSPVQAVFRATRIRVWRIAQNAEEGADFIFQFEYLMSKDSFDWITLVTKQAVLLSLLLQSIGAEILREHRNSTLKADESERMNKTGGYLNTSSTTTALMAIPPVETISITPQDTLNTKRLSDEISEINEKEACDEDNDPLSQGANGNSHSPPFDTKRETGELTTTNASYESFTDFFTTISSALPTPNEVFNITDDDL